MTTSMLSEDDIALAAEFVLGVLEPADAAIAGARVATDRAFADEVARWESNLLPMLDGADAPPPAAVWNNVKAETRPATGQDNTPHGLRFWQGLSLVSTAAAVLLGVMVVTRPVPTAPVIEPIAPMIAALGSDTGKAALTASYDAASGKLTLTPVSLDTGKLYPELWVIPADGKARSLGMVTRDRPSQIIVAAEMRTFIDKGATLAITPEPFSGAPGGKATGPVIASGAMTTI
jgi:anti-sigma-K factor RskA